MKAIYCIVNIVNGDRYIGSAINFYARKRRHTRDLRNQRHHSIILQRAWQKYGHESFKFIVLEQVTTKEELIPREQWWLDNTCPTYNVCKIAGSSLGRKCSEETRRKQSLAKLGKKQSQDQVLNRARAQSGDNHWSKKKSLSNESRKKMSDSQKKLYQSGYISPFKGKKKSDEQIEKIKDKIGKAVLQFNLDGVFMFRWRSVSEAARSINTNNYTIRKNLNNTTNSAVGYVWKWENKYS